MRKIGQFLLTIWLVLTLNFLLPRLMPGDPLADLDNPDSSPVPLSEEARARVLAYYGLDQPLLVQYRDYMVGLFHGELGWSIYYNAPVGQILLARLRWTLALVGVATMLYIVLGIVLGAISAWHYGSLFDRILLITSSTGGAFPAFFLSMVLIVVFGVKLHWLPLGGAQSVTLLRASWPERALDIARHMILPVLALVVTNLNDVYYLTRNSLGQVLGESFITVARAKGLRERALLFRHALPNALLPIITLCAMRLGAIVMGAMLVEVTFSYPGIGRAIYEACVARDYPLLQGAFLVTMLSTMGANLLADGLYVLLDPRLRRQA